MFGFGRFQRTSVEKGTLGLPSQHLAALLARTEDGWKASDTELDDVETLSDLTDLAREVSDEDTVLLLIEQEDGKFRPVLAERWEVTPIAAVAACATEPRASAPASRPAVLLQKSRNSEAASTNSRAMVAARNASSTAASGMATILLEITRRFKSGELSGPALTMGDPDIGSVAEQYGLAFDRGAEPPRHGLRS